MNAYIYCLNEPTVLVDLNGKEPNSCSEQDGNIYGLLKEAADNYGNVIEALSGIAKSAVKFYEKLYEGTWKIIESLPKLGKRGNPLFNNKVYALILSGRAEQYAEKAAQASRIADKLSDVGGYLTAIAVVSDIINGWTTDNERPTDRKITDALVDGSFSYVNIKASAAVGTMVSTGVATAIGATSAGAAIAGGTGIAVIIDKVADIDIGGKSINNHIKDGLYNAYDRASSTLLKGINIVSGVF